MSISSDGRIAEGTYFARRAPGLAILVSVRWAAVEIGRTTTPRGHRTMRAFSFFLSATLPPAGSRRTEKINVCYMSETKLLLTISVRNRS